MTCPEMDWLYDWLSEIGAASVHSARAATAVICNKSGDLLLVVLCPPLGRSSFVPRFLFTY